MKSVRSCFGSLRGDSPRSALELYEKSIAIICIYSAGSSVRKHPSSALCVYSFYHIQSDEYSPTRFTSDRYMKDPGRKRGVR